MVNGVRMRSSTARQALWPQRPADRRTSAKLDVGRTVNAEALRHHPAPLPRRRLRTRKSTVSENAPVVELDGPTVHPLRTRRVQQAQE
jgi:hypothetical protein